MIKIAATLFVALCFQQGASAQVYRCPDPGGRVVMQQTPCAGGSKLDVRPASGHDPVAPAASQNAAAAPTPHSPTPAGKPTLEDERLARERWIKLNDARIAAANQLARCEREQAQIGAQKNYSNNNLAGATRDVSISNEMQAAAAVCRSRSANADRYVNQLADECGRLGCKAPTGL